MLNDYVLEYISGLNSSQADYGDIQLLSPAEIANLSYGGFDPQKFHKYPSSELSTKNALIVALYFGVTLALILTAFEFRKKKSRVRWGDSQMKGIGGLYLAVFLDSYGATMTIPYISILTVQFGCSGFQATMVSSAFALSQTIGTVFLGILADYISKKWILIMTLGFCSVSLWLTGVCTLLPTGNEPGSELLFNWAFLGLLVSRAVGGFFASTVSIIETMIAEQSPPDKLTENIAQVMAYFSLGALMGPVIGGIVYDFGLEVLCYSSGAVTCVNAAWAFTSLDVGIGKGPKHSKARARRRQERKRTQALEMEDPDPETPAEMNPVQEAFATLNRQPFLYLLLFFTIFVTGAPSLYNVVSSLFVLQVYQWGPLEIAGNSLYRSLIGTWAQMSLSGPSSARFGDAGSILLGTLVRCCAYFAYLVVDPATPWVIAPILAITGSMINAQLQSLLTTYAPPHAIGTLFGFMQAARSFGEAVSPPLGGYMIDKDLLLPFRVAGLACICSSILFLPFIWKEPERQPGDDSDDSMTSFASSVSARKVRRERRPSKTENVNGVVEEPFNYLVLIIQWLVPLLVKILSTVLCSFLMHVATYVYVNDMVSFEKHRNDTDTCEYIYPTSDWMVQGLQDASKNSTTLDQKVEVRPASFDQVMMLFPVMVCFFSALTQDLQIWAKSLLTHILFLLLRGILTVVTFVPDSAGWEGCKYKLQDSGVYYFSEEVSKLWPAFDLLKMEVVGMHQDRIGSDVGYCGGSLFSTQTILFNCSCLYALALFELSRRQFLLRKIPMRQPLLVALGVVFSLLQAVEIYLALHENSFYTADVLLSYMLVFLLYTCGPLQLAVKWWCGLGEPRLGDLSQKLKPRPKLFGPLVHFPVAPESIREEGDVFVPMCCVPSCLCDGFHHLVTVKRLVGTDELVYHLEDDSDINSEHHDQGLEQSEDPTQKAIQHWQLENQKLHQEVKELRELLQMALPTV